MQTSSQNMQTSIERSVDLVYKGSGVEFPEEVPPRWSE